MLKRLRILVILNLQAIKKMKKLNQLSLMRQIRIMIKITLKTKENLSLRLNKRNHNLKQTLAKNNLEQNTELLMMRKLMNQATTTTLQ